LCDSGGSVYSENQINKHKNQKTKMALELTGKVTHLLPPTAEEFNGRTFAKQIVVIDYGQTYPVYLALEFDPDKITTAAACQVGDTVEIDFYPQSNEGKNANAGKWFSRINLKSMTILKAVPRAAQAASAPAPTPTPNPNLEVTPQAAAPTATQSALQPNMAAAEDDSLPF
jgi:hypothetical protein